MSLQHTTMEQQLADAIAHANAALRAGSRDPAQWNLVAIGKLQQGDLPGGFEMLQTALRLAPDHAQTLTNLASVLRQQGRLRDAVLHCDAAIAADPSFIDAWLERGFVLTTGGSPDAEDCYRRVIALDPQNAAAHAQLATIAVREGNVQAGRRHAEASVDAEPANVVAVAALARIELDCGGPERAIALIEPLIAEMSEPSPERSLLLNLLGDGFAILRDPDRAFASYARSKSDVQRLNRNGFEQSLQYVANIRLMAADISGFQAWSNQYSFARISLKAKNHFFLIGHPRSGNTLIENILTSIAGVEALEERQTLGAAESFFLGKTHSFDQLARIADQDLDQYRRAYWDKVYQSGISADCQSFVDMDPLKSISLPLIARLFPEARVIITRRDPRDVVWSCFHTNFALSNAAMAFTTLESTARHYDAVMRLTEESLARLPLNAHVVRYDRLVGDFETTTKALCDFAGLAWSADLIRFDRTARSRGVSTASASQVRKPLYDGTRQWEPYAPYLAEVMPILAPWIERFGY